jgi:hypothetical protein
VHEEVSVVHDEEVHAAVPEPPGPHLGPRHDAENRTVGRDVFDRLVSRHYNESARRTHRRRTCSKDSRGRSRS